MYLQKKIILFYFFTRLVSLYSQENIDLFPNIGFEISLKDKKSILQFMKMHLSKDQTTYYGVENTNLGHDLILTEEGDVIIFNNFAIAAGSEKSVIMCYSFSKKENLAALKFIHAKEKSIIKELSSNKRFPKNFFILPYEKKIHIVSKII